MLKKCFYFALILTLIVFPIRANATCPQRQLNKVCNTCKQQGLNSCPICQTCLNYNSFFSNLSNKYNVQAKFTNKTFLYQIELLTRPDTGGIFTYNATIINALGAKTVIGQNLKGYISFDTIAFGLPGVSTSLTSDLLPSGVFSCFASYKANSTDVIKGGCNLILGVADNLSIIAPSSFAIVELTPALN